MMPAPSSDTPAPRTDAEAGSLASAAGRDLRPFQQESRKSILGDSDEDAVRAFLLEFDGKVTTQRAYRKEVERFLWWLHRTSKRLDQVDRFDVQAFRDFLRNPPPELVGPRNRARGTTGWRPFAAPLSEQGVRYALTVLNSLYSYLSDGGHLDTNPFALVKRKGPRPKKQLDKTLDQPTWDLFLRTLTALADSAKGTWHSRVLERELFVCSALYWSACRREELAMFRFGDLHRSWERAGDHLDERWRWQVHGKGDKAELIPVPPQLITAIKRYRGEIICTTDDADAFVLHGIRARQDADKPLCSDQVRDIVVSAAHRVAQVVERDLPLEASLLKKVRPHWIRHARTKHLLDAGVDPRYVQRLLRHASIDTTMIYDSTGDRAFYDAIVASGPVVA